MTTKYLDLQKAFFQRLQKAETGLGDELLHEYTQERKATHSNGEGILASNFSDLVRQAQVEEDAMKMAAKKSGCGGSRAATSLLAAEPMAGINDEIANLVAVGVDEEERAQSFNVHILGELPSNVVTGV